jgi:hypothetical protein
MWQDIRAGHFNRDQQLKLQGEQVLARGRSDHSVPVFELSLRCRLHGRDCP